ncbi:MAG: pyridoxamine 5'-phosphate oxidase family protein [Pseudomonadota bacterium]
MQREMRRKDRAGSPADAWRILEQGEYGVLSTVSHDGQPYATPLSYCLMDQAIYFHCAPEGHKLDNIAANDRVAFCVVGPTQVLAEKFSTAYESAIVFGVAAAVEGAEKQAALEALAAKYSPGLAAEAQDYIAKFFSRTKVMRIAVESLSAKLRPVG